MSVTERLLNAASMSGTGEQVHTRSVNREKKRVMRRFGNTVIDALMASGLAFAAVAPFSFGIRSDSKSSVPGFAETWIEK